MQIRAEKAGRVDTIVSLQIDEISRSYAQDLIKDGRVKVNNKVITKVSEQIAVGDFLFVDIPEPTKLELISEDIPLDIVYEDDDLLVINKPKGMVVHPANGNQNGTLVNAIMHHCRSSLSGINGVARPGIVHRIDKNTSGLLLVAKNDNAHKSLAEQIKKHSLTRGYLAIVSGNVKEAGVINAPIGRSTKDRKKMAVYDIEAGSRQKDNHPITLRVPPLRGRGISAYELPRGVREATTHYKLLGGYTIKGKSVTLLECRLETGRTHQIRVHMAHIGHPVLGDDVYGSKNAPAVSSQGQLLHAYLLGFIHPTTGEYLEFSVLPPKEFLGFLPESLLPLQL